MENNKQDSFYSIYYLCDKFYKWLDNEICAEFSSDIGKWRLIGIESEAYDNIFLYYYNRARVLDNGKYGYINRKGREVIACKYEEAGDFHQNLAFVKENGVGQLINEKGANVSVIDDNKRVEKFATGFLIMSNQAIDVRFPYVEEEVFIDKDIPLNIEGGRLIVRRDCYSLDKGLRDIDGDILIIEEKFPLQGPKGTVLFNSIYEREIARRKIEEFNYQKEKKL